MRGRSLTYGTPDQIGKDEGLGANYNVPLPEKSNIDDYLRAFEPALIKAAENCKPDIIFISCGFDSHHGDPLGNMDLKTEDFSRLTKMLMIVADQYCEGRIVSLLEGGYNSGILKDCILSHIKALMV